MHVVHDACAERSETYADRGRQASVGGLRCLTGREEHSTAAKIVLIKKLFFPLDFTLK